MDRRSRRGLASRDDLINRCAPILLKARPLGVGKGEGVFAPRKPVYQGRPSGSFDIVADHIAQLLAVAAFRQGKQRTQHRLQSRILKGFREICSR